MTPEKFAELEATAAERAETLGLEHVTDGAQPYHAGVRIPDVHVPGNEAVAEVEPTGNPLPLFDGSGSERWYGEGEDWTQTVGAGLTDDTSALPTLAPTSAESSSLAPAAVTEEPVIAAAEPQEESIG